MLLSISHPLISLDRNQLLGKGLSIPFITAKILRNNIVLIYAFWL